MGKAGRLKSQRYTWEHTLDRTEDAYRVALEVVTGTATSVSSGLPSTVVVRRPPRRWRSIVCPIEPP